MSEYSWDVFLSHASEDTESIARPLAEELRKRGFKVWFDKYQLKIGDSLRRSIDEGIARSKFGVVLLSPDFFSKVWTQRELDALLSKEELGNKVLLPIWHNISHDEINKYSPLISNRLAANTSNGVNLVVEQIVAVLGDPLTTDKPVFEPSETLRLYDEIIIAFNPDYIEALRELPDNIRDMYIEKFKSQENAARILLSVKSPLLLSDMERNKIINAFTPFMDPRLHQTIIMMLNNESVDPDLLAYKEIIKEFEIPSICALHMKPNVLEVITKLHLDFQEEFVPFSGSVINAHLGAIAIHQTLVHIIEMDDTHAALFILVMRLLWSADHDKLSPAWLRKVVFQDFLLLNHTKQGWIISQLLLLQDEIRLIQQIQKKNIPLKDYDMPELHETVSLNNIWTALYSSLSKIQPKIIQRWSLEHNMGKSN